MSNVTYLLVSPNFTQGHFFSWHNLIIEKLKSENVAYFEITNETQICAEIHSDNRNSAHKANNQEDRAKETFKNKYILFIKNNLQKTPVMFRIVKYSYVIIMRIYHASLRSNFSSSQPHAQIARRYTKIEVALEMSNFIPGRIKLLHFYAEDLNGESTTTLQKLNESQIEIHLFGFDLNSLNKEKILTLSSCKSFGVSNDYSLIWLAKNLGSKFSDRGYVIPDFPLNASAFSIRDDISTTTPTVLLIGDISERKNLELFLRAALSDSKKEYLWKIVGRIHENSISLNSRKLLNKALKARSSNVLINSNFVTNEEFVSEISKSNFVFLMYKDWLWGSNVATHAIQFTKFCLISPNTSLEQIFESTNLGLKVATDSVRDLMNSLRMSSFQKPNLSAIENMLEKHSRTNFLEIFTKRVLQS